MSARTGSHTPRSTPGAGIEEASARENGTWRERATHAARDVRRLTDLLALERASAVVEASVGDVVLSRRRMPRQLATARAWLRLWQGRADDAWRLGLEQRLVLRERRHVIGKIGGLGLGRQAS